MRKFLVTLVTGKRVLCYVAPADMTHPYFIARPMPVEAVRG